MRKQFLLDAVETATNIHKGDFSSLRGKSFVICDSMKKKRRGRSVKKSNKEKMTLAKLAKIVSDGFNRIETRLDYIVKANNLKDLPRTK